MEVAMYRNASLISSIVFAVLASVIHAEEPPKTVGLTAEDVAVLVLSTNLADAGVGE